MSVLSGFRKPARFQANDSRFIAKPGQGAAKKVLNSFRAGIVLAVDHMQNTADDGDRQFMR